jgi:hypothetical protein
MAVKVNEAEMLSGEELSKNQKHTLDCASVPLRLDTVSCSFAG